MTATDQLNDVIAQLIAKKQEARDKGNKWTDLSDGGWYYHGKQIAFAEAIDLLVEARALGAFNPS